MAYLYIENFEGGLDTRKTRFTAPAGSLRQLKNAHITRGKEIERRKAFTEIASLPAGTFGLHSLGNRIFVFGSAVAPTGLPNELDYQTLSGNANSMSGMVRFWDAENFAGKIYAISEHSDGHVYHYYDGERVTDWDTISAGVATAETVAEALTLRLQESPVFMSESFGDTIRLTGDLADDYSVTVDSGSLSITVLQAAASVQPETRATATLTVTGGSPAPGVNTLSILTLDGQDLIGSFVDYDTDDSTTAAAIATRINAGVTSYDASAVGDTVTITAPAGLGATANGRVLYAETTGDVAVTTANMSGGVDATPAAAKIVEVRVFAEPTADPSMIYGLEIEGSTVYRINGIASAVPIQVKAVKQKIYAITGSLVYFSGFRGTYAGAGSKNPALPDPTMWVNYEDDPNDYGIGAGAFNLSEQLGGRERGVSLAVYQSRLAVFTESTVQIWNVDPDPDLNSIYQVLLNTGATSPFAVVEYGDQDIFFLAESGVRSLRARDSSNLASASDVGVSIDQDLAQYIREQGVQILASATAVVEPEDGRYLLAIGDRIYVFSNFSGSSVNAWSTYELSAGDVDFWATTTRKLFCRIGDSVRQYGGPGGLSYDTDETVVELPFLDAGQPAQEKQITGVDFGGIGVWEAKMATEPSLPDETDIIAVFDGDTYGSVGRAGVQGKSTHISLRLTTSQASEAVIGNVVIHYYPIEAS